MKLHDVQVLYWNGQQMSNPATIAYSKPFTLARSIARIEIGLPKYPKGTVILPIPNGVNPLEYIRDKKLKLKPK